LAGSALRDFRLLISNFSPDNYRDRFSNFDKTWITIASKKMTTTYAIQNLSTHLFWDVDVAQLTFEKSKEQIIYKVLEFGLMEDWKILQEVYGLDTIREVSLELRSLDEVTLAFLSNLFKIDKTNFRCYKLKQSNPNCWNY
jgi:hypothetical protein